MRGSCEEGFMTVHKQPVTISLPGHPTMASLQRHLRFSCIAPYPLPHRNTPHYPRFVCVRQLKSVRKQFNEYQTMKRTLLYTTGALFSYAGVVLFVLGDDLTMQRRVAIFCESLILSFLRYAVNRFAGGILLSPIPAACRT